MMPAAAATRIASPCALISMAAVRHNVSVIRAAIPAATRICAILKADAYGHGAAAIARELAGSGVRRQPLIDAIAVASFDEAEGLGRVSVPLYVLRPVENLYVASERKRAEDAIRAGWILSVNSVPGVQDLVRLATSLNVPALIQIALDTGMARAGAPVEQFGAIAAAIEAGQPWLRVVGVCTHFVASEEAADPLTGEQMALFRRATDAYAAGRPGLIRHAANSGGIFHYAASHLDMVRPGKALYGIDPAGSPVAGRALKPVLKFVAPLLMIRDIRAGQSVGYNGTFTAQRDMRIGLVPVGFADGYRRCLSSKGVMVLNGQSAPVVGRVSMDYTTIDLTDVPHPAVGDTVTVIDDDPASPASAYRLAALADTIPSELFCGIGLRVPRVPTHQEVPSESGAGSRKSRIAPQRLEF